MDVSLLETAITTKTRAIIPVHLYGSCVDVAAVMAVAARHGIAVIEDAAQAQGASTRGKRAGATALAGCFSFYPGKNLGACGDAGAVITSNPEIAARVRQARDHGRVGKKYEHASVGRNSRMDGLQGAILRVKLRHLDAWNARRREIAAAYRRLLAGSDVVPVAVPKTSEPVYHQFVVKTAGRDALRRALEARGIQTGIHYPIPLHRQPAFAPYLPRCAADTLAATDAAAASILSLPMYPERSDQDVRRAATSPAAGAWLRGRAWHKRAAGSPAGAPRPAPHRSADARSVPLIPARVAGSAAPECGRPARSGRSVRSRRRRSRPRERFPAPL